MVDEEGDMSLIRSRAVQWKHSLKHQLRKCQSLLADCVALVMEAGNTHLKLHSSVNRNQDPEEENAVNKPKPGFTLWKINTLMLYCLTSFWTLLYIILHSFQKIDFITTLKEQCGFNIVAQTLTKSELLGPFAD